jgi:hypothetical protein
MGYVFDERWIAELTKQNVLKSKHQQSRLYRLIIDPKRSELREWIEQQVALLPSNKQHRVVGQLRSIRSFEATCNELVVGATLRRFGHDPQYEADLGGKTPDWYVDLVGHAQFFIVEVVTVFPPQEVMREEQLGEQLRDRLQSIQDYFHLMLNVEHGNSLVGVDQVAIVRFAAEWLRSISPTDRGQPHKTRYTSDGFSMDLTAVPRKTSHKASVLSGGPLTTMWVDSRRLKNALRQKLSKYRQAKELGIPLAVAVVPTFSSGLGADDLLDVLFGQEQLVLQHEGDTILGSGMSRARNGMILPQGSDDESVVLNTRLSAVLLILGTELSDVKVVHNPYARHPISQAVFPGSSHLSL